jgi:hypothetical protein
MTRARYRPKTPGSRLEETFLRLWRLAGGPELEREYRFYSERRWRADFAHLRTRCLIKIEGGIWVNGRHNRAAGFKADLEPSRPAGGEMDSAQRSPEGSRPVRRGASQKYLEAGLSGWRVFRLGPDQITMPVIGRLAAVVRADQ